MSGKRERLEKPSAKVLSRIPGIWVDQQGRYVLKVSAKSTKTGTLSREKVTLPLGSTTDQVLKALAETKARLRSGGTPLPTVVKVPTLGAYAPQWMKRNLSREGWSREGGTVAAVTTRLEQHILPVLGSYLLDQITYSDMQAFLDHMVAKKKPNGKPYARSTVGVTYSHLCCMVREGLRDHNLPALPDYPTPKRYKSTKSQPLITWENYASDPERAFNREELDRFLTTAKQVSPRWYGVALLGFGSGARFSELAACQVGDLDLTNDVGIWLVRRHYIPTRDTFAPGTKNNPAGEVKLIDPITTKSLRPFLADKIGEALLFAPWGQQGASIIKPQSFQGFLDLVSKKTGLPRVTSKVLRRTYITLSHLSARTDAMTQAAAGHSTPQMSMNYVKPGLDERTKHSAKMGSVLYLSKPGSTGEN